MKHLKDLSWLSAPAFLLIIGMLVVYSIRQNPRSPHSEKAKSGISALPSQKPA
jgi:hypothetical protein